MGDVKIKRFIENTPTEYFKWNCPDCSEEQIELFEPIGEDLYCHFCTQKRFEEQREKWEWAFQKANAHLIGAKIVSISPLEDEWSDYADGRMADVAVIFIEDSRGQKSKITVPNTDELFLSIRAIPSVKFNKSGV